MATLILLATLFSFVPSSHAKADNEFSKEYGLLVHNLNQDRGVPRIKALNVLFNYFDVDVKSGSADISFSDVKPESRAFNTVNKGCQLNFYDCSTGNFQPMRSISQKDFLSWFFKLKYLKKPNYLDKLYPKISDEHLKVWLEARRLNLLSDNEITYKVLQDFLYRNSVVEEHLDQPYREGLMVDLKEINANNYHSLKEINLIQNNLREIIREFDKKDDLDAREKSYLSDTRKKLEVFNELKESLVETPYILRKRPDLDPDVTRTIRRYGLQEILYSYSYDYSKNAPYRKYNLATGVMKMAGRVFMPNDEIDYWKIISDKNLSDFKYGWVIAQGEEQWQFGGGICGSSSMVFLPSWSAGLEILERRSHSKYYTNLYPLEKIGLDATVYRPKPNLRIRNNMDSPIVYNVTNDTENQILTVEIIGNKDYKDVRIEGPIYEKWNLIKWVRHYEDFDGKIISDVLESRYGSIY